MTHISLKCLLIGVALGASQVRAAQMTWQECVRSVIENNDELKASRAAVGSADANEGVAKSGFFPQLNATVGYGLATPSTWDINLSQTNPARSFNGTFKLTQNLFNGFQDYEKWRASQSTTRASRSALAILKAQISLNLKTAYQGYIYARAYEKMTGDIIKRRAENLRIVELRFQSGRENKGSVLLSRAYFNQSKFDDLEAANLKEVARTQLRRALGVSHVNLEVVGDVPVREVPATPPDFYALAATTPAHLQAEWQADAKAHEYQASRGTFMPALNLTGEYGTAGDRFYPHVQHWTMGVNISFAVFNGGKDYSSLRAASFAKVESEHKRANTVQLTAVNLQTAYTKLVEAIEKLKVDQSFRDAAIVRAEIARKKYNNGLISFDDWDVIENDLIDREKNYLISRRDRILKEAAWENALGVGVIP